MDEVEEDAFVNWRPLGSKRYVSCETLYPCPSSWTLQASDQNEGFRWGTATDGTKPIDLEYMRTFCCGHGGLVAFVRDESKLVLQLGVPESEERVHVCTLSGTLVENVELHGLSITRNRILHVGWTGDERLVVVTDRGWTLVYSEVGSGHSSCDEFSLGTACEQEGLEEVKVFSTGVCARTRENHFWGVGDFEARMPFRLADPDMPGATVHCFDVIPSLGGELEIVVAVGSDLAIVDAGQSLKFAAGLGPFVQVASSPNGLMIAAVNCHDIIYIFHNENIVVEISLEEAAMGEDDSSFQTPSGTPTLLAWCGVDAVVAHWEDTSSTLFVDVDGACTWISLGEVVTITPELDGAVFLRRGGMQFCRLVPQDAVDVLEPGSVRPGALLHDARELLGKEDVRSASELLAIVDQGDLEEAVQTCLNAAGFELSVSRQQSLIRAACFGMAFAPLASHDTKSRYKRGTKVVELARSLRILNALRQPHIGLPLTLVQLGSLGLPRILERLCTLGHFLLALDICESMGHTPQNILLKWGKRKISATPANVADKNLFDALVENLNAYPEVPWSSIAKHALQRGRKYLASMLIDLDTAVKRQIPLLLQTGGLEDAVRKSSVEGDPDTIFQVIKQGGPGVRKMLLESPSKEYQGTEAILKEVERIRGHALYLDYLAQARDHDTLALFHSRQGPLSTNVSASTSSWNHAKAHLESVEEAKKEGKLLSSACVAAQRLQQIQGGLEASSGRDIFLGHSVAGTVRQCILFGLTNDAKKIAKEFKMSDRQFAMISLDAMCRAKDWVAVTHFMSKLDRRGAIQPEDVMEYAVAHNAPMHALQGIVDAVDPDIEPTRKSRMAASIGMEQQAPEDQSTMFQGIRNAVGTKKLSDILFQSR